MIDKIKALIKKANELDLDNKFKDADLIDNMIKEALEIGLGTTLTTDTADKFFKENFSQGSTTYNEQDDIISYKKDCGTEDELSQVKNKVESMIIDESCELDKKCSLKNPLKMGSEFYSKIKLSHLPKLGVCLIQLSKA